MMIDCVMTRIETGERNIWFYETSSCGRGFSRQCKPWQADAHIMKDKMKVPWVLGRRETLSQLKAGGKLITDKQSQWR